MMSSDLFEGDDDEGTTFIEDKERHRQDSDVGESDLEDFSNIGRESEHIGKEKFMLSTALNYISMSIEFIFKSKLL